MKASHIPTQAYGNPPAQQQSSTQQYSAAAQYSNTYPAGGYPVVNATNYGTVPETQSTQQPVRPKTQRARVPPPSKVNFDFPKYLLAIQQEIYMMIR